MGLDHLLVFLIQVLELFNVVPHFLYLFGRRWYWLGLFIFLLNNVLTVLRLFLFFFQVTLGLLNLVVFDRAIVFFHFLQIVLHGLDKLLSLFLVLFEVFLDIKLHRWLDTVNLRNFSTFVFFLMVFCLDDVLVLLLKL